MAVGRIDISITDSGTIAGGAGVAVRTDNGSDAFDMIGGVVTGQIRQGDGIDTFTMTAGQVDSVDQGDGRDTFTMSGGRVVGALASADVAHITNGRIGNADLNVARISSICRTDRSIPT